MHDQAFVKVNPGGLRGTDQPQDCGRQVDGVPARRAGRVDEFQVQKHRNRQSDHCGQHHKLRRIHREKHQHHHVPTGRKAGKAFVFGFHPRVGKIDDRAIGDHHDGDPAGPAGQQALGEQRIGRDEHIRQVIDDQVHQHPVVQRPVRLGVIAAGQRTVDAVHDQRHYQPKEHQAPLALHRRQHRQHRQD